ncbi:MAG: Do family serine endopeptidase [Planctomycetaceae bacterium]
MTFKPLPGLLCTIAAVTGLLPVRTSSLVAQPTVPEQAAINHAEALSTAFRAAARDSLPAVVSVVSRMKPEPVSRGNREMSSAEEELFRRFFGDDFGGFERMQPGRPQLQEGRGSGFVVDPQGVIVTNSHVVNGADSVLVVFQDGTELAAESWVTDPWSDVAIVRVKSEQPLASIAFDDSDQIEIGDWVLALGDPFGVGTSVTAGIISGKGRAPHINAREDFLQTDAAINPGNSGGPLVNLAGKVVGINTAISTRSGGYDGVGFAVPSNLAHWVTQQLIEQGKVNRPYLGVAVQPLTAELRKQFGIGLRQGALVAQTFPDSPAQKAGIQPGDVILDVNEAPVDSGVALQGIVERLKIDTQYPIQLLRDGQRKSIPVRLEAMPEQFASSPARRSSNEAKPQPTESKASGVLGVEVAELTADVRQQLGLEEAVSGVVVTNVTPDGPAAEKGVNRGDVVERIGTTPVTSVAEFDAAVSKASGQNGILLLLRTSTGTRFVVVPPRSP